MNRAIAAALLISLLPSTLVAQVPGGTRAVKRGGVKVRGGGVSLAKPKRRGLTVRTSAAGRSAAKLAAGGAAAKPQAITNAAFDRRPSAVLGAMAPDAKSPADGSAAALSARVTRGDWGGVAAIFSDQPAASAGPLYQRMLQELGREFRMGPQVASKLIEQHLLTPRDVAGLADAAPVALELKELELLGALLARSAAQGHAIKPALELWEAGTRRLGGDERGPRDKVAQVLLAGGFPKQARGFLPSADEAMKAKSHRAIELLARFHKERAGAPGEERMEHLEKAWRLGMSLIGSEVSAGIRGRSLRAAVALVPKLGDALGKRWLEESFTKKPERGRELLSAVGADVASARAKLLQKPDDRLGNLRLQKLVVDAVLAGGETAPVYSTALGALAQNWLAEARYTILSGSDRNEQVRRDRYGNVFYMNQYNAMRQQVRPIGARELLEVRPGEAWLSELAASLRPSSLGTIVELLLVAEEEQKAFPIIEELAKVEPARAHTLAEGFLKVWVSNNQMNKSQGKRNRYAYIWGFERRANAIPLTRSRQDRNLAALGSWLARIRALPIEPVDEELLVEAFVLTHSAAEVYRREAIEGVFGPIDGMQPKTLARLVQVMRGNLAGLWRDPRVQKRQNTRRRDTEIEAELLRGYQLATRLVQAGLVRSPADWSLRLAEAALLFEQNAYENQTVKVSARFTEGRRAAFEAFARAASDYAAGQAQRNEDEESLEPYLQWFSASLGACDLRKVTHEHVPERAQPALIRSAIEALGGAVAERHKSRFANALFSRLSAVNPAVKFSYLKAGFEVVGDHPDARQARRVMDFYVDLVSEVQLRARVDGSTRVGHGRPFGLFIDIRHTSQIEREAGGFDKYLQNQNQVTGAFNYGRPLEDYRDRFQEAATKVLSEHFEVISVTFHKSGVKSRGDPEPGWRVTPYAYLVLKPLGAQVDRIPALEMTFDFLDISGYAALPISSSHLAIDAASEAGDARPFTKLEVSQILDERRAADGELVLEVKAKARGLLPPIAQLLSLDWPDFELISVDDEGVAAARLDAELEGAPIVSERTALVTLKGRSGLTRLPKEFRFASLTAPGKLERLRYADADLVAAPETVSLEGAYGERSRASMWWAVTALAAGLLLVLALRRLINKVGPVERQRYTLPTELTAFSLLQLLGRFERDEVFEAADQARLADTIAELEASYYKAGSQGGRDLGALAEDWLERANRS